MKLVKRDSVMDIAKAIGIVLVVVGHSGSPFTRFIYLFHMPLFFFISGYFYNENYSDNPWKLVQKRIKSLWIPFVFYSMIFLLLHNVFCKLQIYSNNEFYKKSSYGIINTYNVQQFLNAFEKILSFERSEQLAGALWFFLTLFIVNIIFVMISFYIRKVTKIKYKEIVRCLFIGIFFLVGVKLYDLDVHTIKKFEVAFIAILFFYTGYIYKRFKYKNKFNKWNLFLCFIFLIFGSFKGKIDLVSNAIINPLFLIFNSYIGIYLIIGISEFLCNTKKEFKLIRYIGNNTIPILCLHFLMFRIVNYMQVVLYNLPYYRIASHPILNGQNGWWILYSISGIVLPLLIKNIVLNIKRAIMNCQVKCDNSCKNA
ncbi:MULTISPECIES: acyltransferase family protein [unclassified Clostridium]|uniref:acyltransferase family protein n=1 Tax=unclassified Clostridium TaxID=2614128 RepID=UPI00207A90E0|nr:MULTISPECIES: acyltransferase family protein [unclassified Clostridium]